MKKKGFLRIVTRFIGASIGETLLLGLGAGTMYVLGYVKGTTSSPEAKRAVAETKNTIKHIIDSTETKPTNDQQED